MILNSACKIPYRKRKNNLYKNILDDFCKKKRKPTKSNEPFVTLKSI